MSSTWVVKEWCQTGGVGKSNGRQVIIPRLWQWGSWWLEGRPLRRWPKVSQFPLSMQAPLHTVTKRTGSNALSVQVTGKIVKSKNRDSLISRFLRYRRRQLGWHPLWLELRTYRGVLDEAVVAPDTSSAAGRALDSSEETSCFEGALSSAREW